MDKRSNIFSSANARTSDRQVAHGLVNDRIVELVKALQEPQDAEYLWLELEKTGHKMSISSFYGRLRKLVSAGSIVKINPGNNKAIYFHS